jgi:hypothetical protein
MPDFLYFVEHEMQSIDDQDFNESQVAEAVEALFNEG